MTYVKDSLTPGIIYKFRYRARNVYGWSPYSNVLYQAAASKPDEPLPPTTKNTATSVTITWKEPYNGSSPILAYRVYIATSLFDKFSIEKTYCNAEFDNTVIKARSCSIPMSVLTTAPFNLV